MFSVIHVLCMYVCMLLKLHGGNKSCSFMLFNFIQHVETLYNNTLEIEQSALKISVHNNGIGINDTGT